MELRDWMNRYPELFATPLQQWCFVRIVLATLGSDQVPQMKPFYRSLPYSENAVRAYLRSLANGGWIAFDRSTDGDGRCVGFHIEPRFKAVREEYFAMLDRSAAVTHAARPANAESAEPDDAAENGQSPLAMASANRYLP